MVPEAVAIWCVLVLVIDTASLVSVWRSRRHSRKAKALWTVVVCGLPYLGALAWFALARERRHGPRPDLPSRAQWGPRPKQ